MKRFSGINGLYKYNNIISVDFIAHFTVHLFEFLVLLSENGFTSIDVQFKC